MLRKLTLVLFLFLLVSSSQDIQAQHKRDTIEIQAFTFYNARDSFIVFPSDTNRYEKIIMYYTLKCDPRQNPRCGEWDYLTYTNLFYPSGKLDSLELKQPVVVWNGDGKDTARFRRKGYWNYSPRKEYFFNRTGTSKSDSAIIGSGAITKPVSPLANNSRIQRSQVLLRADELQSAGLNPGAITGLRLNLGMVPLYARDLQISMAHILDTQLTGFANVNMTDVYSRSFSNPLGSWTRIEFTDSFAWDGNSNLLLEMSYDNWSAPNIIAQNTCSADSTPYSSFATSTSSSKYFKLDGVNDYIDAGEMSFLDSTATYTLEAWIKVDKWKSWVKPFGKGSPLGFELGSNVGDLFTMVRTSGNTYGSAPGILTEGKWHHVATVYDGRGATNAERLKLFVDGQKVSLNYNGTIPAKSPISANHFSFGGWNGSQAFNGCQNNMRIWASALNDTLIRDWYNVEDLSLHPELSELKAHYLGENTVAFS